MTMIRPVDIVTVPDFSSARARCFEARTLFFLAAWIEHAGPARDFPLHVACIGEPPESVRRLAAIAGASVTVHEPVGADPRGFSNKMRGLEVEARTGAILLLDNDMLVLGDVSALGEFAGCIAVGPGARPRVTEDAWHRVYAALDLEFPEERMTSLIAELASFRPGKKIPSRFRSMVPAYHGAALLAPTRSDLRELWEAHMRRIGTAFSEDDPHWRNVVASAEPGMATAIEVLKRRGTPVSRLPDSFNVRWNQVVAGTRGWDTTRIFHAEDLFRDNWPEPVDLTSLRGALTGYADRVIEARTHPSRDFERLITVDVDNLSRFMHTLEDDLHQLLERHVAPALAGSAPLPTGSAS